MRKLSWKKRLFWPFYWPWAKEVFTLYDREVQVRQFAKWQDAWEEAKRLPRKP